MQHFGCHNFTWLLLERMQCNALHGSPNVETGFELQDIMTMAADYNQTESEIASLLVGGKVPIVVGQNTKIKNCIIGTLLQMVMVLRKPRDEMKDFV